MAVMTRDPERPVATRDAVTTQPASASQATHPELRDEAWYLWNSSPALRLVAMTAAVAAVIVLAWLLFARPFDGKSTEITAGGGPVQSSPAQLAALGARLNHPIYWAGAAPDKNLEATLTADGLVFVRYLPAGVPVGNPVPRYLTVGTYPDPTAFSDLQRYARQTHAITRPVTGGGFAMVVRGSPRSVFLAYRGVPVQVEVYDPHRSHALSMIASGTITPVR